MEKESYSIDDILSEVKQHKENELRRTQAAEKGAEESSSALQDERKISDEAEIEPTEPDEELFVIEEKEIGTDKQETVPDEPASEESEEQINETAQAETENSSDGEEKAEDYTNEADSTVEGDNVAETDNTPDTDGYVDLLEISNLQEPITTSAQDDIKAPKKKKERSRAKKTARNIIIILLVLILIVGAGVAIYINRALNSITDDNNNRPSEQEWRGMSQLIENYPEINETGAEQLSSLQDMIKTWYYNGAPCSSTHVLNVLLIGEDTRGQEILEVDTRADSAIIVSVNIDTKQITLTSVLRDAYAYWENTPGDPTTGEFGKINGSMVTGIDTYINCVERFYKIDIDNYVIVNFDSFEKIIDEIGGVEIEITSAEINEINNDQETYDYVTIEKTFEGRSGTLLLDGRQALAYCRIRHLDSDNVRADRQKTCLYKIFDKVREGSGVTQLKVVNALLPYVKTGFGSSEIVSIAKYALSQDWLNYDVSMITVPNARINEYGAGGEYYGAWCWKCDYPQDANFLQTMLYGKSSVTLAQNRVDILRCNLYGFFEETQIPCYSTITNYSYGETTTYEAPTTFNEESTDESTSN